MVQRTWSNVTLQSTGTFAPNAQGWDLSALPSFTSVDGALQLQTIDLNDTNLTIESDIEATNDAAGNSGWFLLSGSGWQGGPTGRDHTPKQPTMGPFSTTNWPPIKRARVHVSPSRNVPNVSGVVNAN